MNNLIIDAANEKILFKIITITKSYTSEYPNSRKILTNYNFAI